MGDFLRCGMTMRTPAYTVDLVPLFRRLDGDKEVPILTDERPAAVLALTHMGVSIDQIAKALSMAHRDIRAVLSKHDMEPIVFDPPESYSYIGLAYTSNTQRREQRRSDRVMVDGRLVHPGEKVPHGTETGYTEWGCQCEPCTGAHAQTLAGYRAKRARAA